MKVHRSIPPLLVFAGILYAAQLGWQRGSEMPAPGRIVGLVETGPDVCQVESLAGGKISVTELPCSLVR